MSYKVGDEITVDLCSPGWPPLHGVVVETDPNNDEMIVQIDDKEAGDENGIFIRVTRGKRN